MNHACKLQAFGCGYIVDFNFLFAALEGMGAVRLRAGSTAFLGVLEVAFGVLTTAAFRLLEAVDVGAAVAPLEAASFTCLFGFPNSH